MPSSSILWLAPVVKTAVRNDPCLKHLKHIPCKHIIHSDAHSNTYHITSLLCLLHWLPITVWLIPLAASTPALYSLLPYFWSCPPDSILPLHSHFIRQLIHYTLWFRIPCTILSCQPQSLPFCSSLCSEHSFLATPPGCLLKQFQATA